MNKSYKNTRDLSRLNRHMVPVDHIKNTKPTENQAKQNLMKVREPEYTLEFKEWQPTNSFTNRDKHHNVITGWHPAQEPEKQNTTRLITAISNQKMLQHSMKVFKSRSQNPNKNQKYTVSMKTVHLLPYDQLISTNTPYSYESVKFINDFITKKAKEIHKRTPVGASVSDIIRRLKGNQRRASSSLEKKNRYDTSAIFDNSSSEIMIHDGIIYKQFPLRKPKSSYRQYKFYIDKRAEMERLSLERVKQNLKRYDRARKSQLLISSMVSEANFQG